MRISTNNTDMWYKVVKAIEIAVNCYSLGAEPFFFFWWCFFFFCNNCCSWLIYIVLLSQLQGSWECIIELGPIRFSLFFFLIVFSCFWKIGIPSSSTAVFHRNEPTPWYEPQLKKVYILNCDLKFTSVVEQVSPPLRVTSLLCSLLLGAFPPQWW